MISKDQTQLWHNPQLDIELLRAFYVEHAFPRHTHDYYVVSLILRGRQSFTHRGTKYVTPPGGLILINPEAPHTGEAVDEQGFEMLCFYPTPAHMQQALAELTGRAQGLPFFKEARVEGNGFAGEVIALHRALTSGAGPLECEARLLQVLTGLIQRYADVRRDAQPFGTERQAIRQARAYLEEHFGESISLRQLANAVSLSPYYFLRAFRAEMGIPPYTYLESVRVARAQGLIKAGKPLAEVAIEVGFNSQSHFTSRFKQILGVTPGQYAQRQK